MLQDLLQDHSNSILRKIVVCKIDRPYSYTVRYGPLLYRPETLSPNHRPYPMPVKEPQDSSIKQPQRDANSIAAEQEIHQKPQQTMKSQLRVVQRRWPLGTPWDPYEQINSGFYKDDRGPLIPTFSSDCPRNPSA